MDLTEQFRQAKWLRSLLIVELRDFILLTEIIEKANKFEDSCWFVIELEGLQCYCDDLI